MQTRRLQKNKEDKSCQIIFPALALTGSQCQDKRTIFNQQSVTTGWCHASTSQCLYFTIATSTVLTRGGVFPNIVSLLRSTSTEGGTSGYAPQKRLQRREEIRDSLQCVYRHINHPCIIHAPSNYANPNYFWGNYHSLSANSQNCLGFPTHYPLRLSPNIAIFHILIFSANDPILHRIQRNNNALSMNNESTASYTALQWCTGQTA